MITSRLPLQIWANTDNNNCQLPSPSPSPQTHWHAREADPLLILIKTQNITTQLEEFLLYIPFIFQDCFYTTTNVFILLNFTYRECTPKKRENFVKCKNNSKFTNNNLCFQSITGGEDKLLNLKRNSLVFGFQPSLKLLS